MNHNSLNYFVGELMAQIFRLNKNDWVVTSLGSGHCDDGWYWLILIKNIKTKEEKNIKIPCYKT